jgi:signal transduction histidine kinase
MDTNPDIEPGVLALFRLFVAVEWLLFSLGLLSLLRPFGTPNFMAILSWGPTTLLLGYLCWPQLQRKLGAHYLPLALSVAAIMPIISHSGAALLYMRAGRSLDALRLDPVGLYLWLLLPLLLISVQYGYRAVLTFTIGTAVLSILCALPFLWSARSFAQAIISSAVGRTLLFTLAGLVVARLAAAQRRLRHELAKQHAQLANYAVTLEQLAVSRERNRLARELHDTLAHTLSALSVQLAAIDVQLDNPSAARKTLCQAQALTSTGLDEARRALGALRTSPVEALGLLGALKQLAERTAERAGLRLHLALPAQIATLPPDVELHLFRIADEALENVVRHAQAHELTLALCTDTSSLQLSIKDNGRGFDVLAPTSDGHYGLLGMRERATLLGAKLSFHSQPGRGTSVVLTLPFGEQP